MFYPEASLKRGGRFYLCWVADSWPVRFGMITRRQLWSQDIRKVCNDLLEVMTRESGSPSNRFSLRLSSQLMRGLVRLYKKKVGDLLDELCMVNATIFRHTNKKWEHKEQHVKTRDPVLEMEFVPLEHPEAEERVVEIIQNSGNAVARIEDITLREEAIPNIVIIPDGFGEEPAEAMLGAGGGGAGGASGAGGGSGWAELDLSEAPRCPRPRARAERLSDHDVTVFSKSMAVDELRIDLDTEIPQIPDILPDILVPAPRVAVEELSEKDEQAATTQDKRSKETMELVLEELEEIPSDQVEKRRKRKRLIIDKKIMLDGAYINSRLKTVNIEQRCESSAADAARAAPPAHALLRRPARARLACGLRDLFARNLGVVRKQPLADREMEALRGVKGKNRSKRGASLLHKILEENETAPRRVTRESLMRCDNEPIAAPHDEYAPIRFADECGRVDISDLPTQVLETESQKQKRIGDEDCGPSPKKPRMGVVSFKRSQNDNLDRSQHEGSRHRDASETLLELYADARPPGPDHAAPDGGCGPLQEISRMLRAAGLCAEPELPAQAEGRQKKSSSESESPLGSLDRTKVSLGDSDDTTDSRRLFNEHWGAEGTMKRIIQHIRLGVTPLTVRVLIESGPKLAQPKTLIAAKCFTSIIKLKQHRFLELHKDSSTLEITNITVGSKIPDVGAAPRQSNVSF